MQGNGPDGPDLVAHGGGEMSGKRYATKMMHWLAQGEGQSIKSPDSRTISKRPADLPKAPNGYAKSSHTVRNERLAADRADRKSKGVSLVQELLKRYTAKELGCRCGVSANFIFQVSSGRINASATTIKILEGLA